MKFRKDGKSRYYVFDDHATRIGVVWRDDEGWWVTYSPLWWKAPDPPTLYPTRRAAADALLTEQQQRRHT